MAETARATWRRKASRPDGRGWPCWRSSGPSAQTLLLGRYDAFLLEDEGRRAARLIRRFIASHTQSATPLFKEVLPEGDCRAGRDDHSERDRNGCV